MERRSEFPRVSGRGVTSVVAGTDADQILGGRAFGLTLDRATCPRVRFPVWKQAEQSTGKDNG